MLKLQLRISKETSNSILELDRWPLARLLYLDGIMAEADEPKIGG